jgi:CubicO group peptidase (beta-lactamase class C family)
MHADVLTAAIAGYVDRGELAGAAAAVWRDGETTTVHSGWRDIEARLPVERDTLFRVASMSKPITSMAALMLYDEGRFALEDPIADWAPEFARMHVLRSPDGPLDDTIPAERPITFADLLTHRSGLTYGAVYSGPIAEAYRSALGRDIDSEVAPEDWITGLASLPLVAQPGAAFHYGHSTDLLGFLVARMEQASLGEVLEQRIFTPLGMKDTGFAVAPGKRSRRSAMHGFDDAGGLVKRDSAAGDAFLPERPEGMAFESGGQGLWSTVDDYLAFARIFVGGGAVEGIRLIQPATLKRMTANWLTDRQRAEAQMLGMPVFAGHGFGLGLAVVLDPEKASVLRGRGGVGTVSWPGAYGGWWQADPTDGSVMVFLAHNMFELDQISRGVGLGVYSAITDFHALASSVRP